MKALSILAATQAVLTLSALPTPAQTCPVWGECANSALFGSPVRASEIIGSAIRNCRDEKLGAVKDVAIDLQNGEIVEIIVSRGGYLVDQKLVGVPSQLFNVESGGKLLRCALDKATLDGAPTVDLLNWNETMTQCRVAEVHRYFGVKPYFQAPEFLPQNATQFEPAGRIAHLSALNHQDQNIGKVQDLILDLPQGRVVEVVIASGHFLGIKDELSPVPPQALGLDVNRGNMTLNVTKKALAQAPHFPGGAWPRITREQVGGVYRAYSAYVIPYYLPAGWDDIAQNDVSPMPSVWLPAMGQD